MTLSSPFYCFVFGLFHVGTTQILWFPWPENWVMFTETPCFWLKVYLCRRKPLRLTFIMCSLCHRDTPQLLTWVNFPSTDPCFTLVFIPRFLHLPFFFTFSLGKVPLSRREEFHQFIPLVPPLPEDSDHGEQFLFLIWTAALSSYCKWSQPSGSTSSTVKVRLTGNHSLCRWCLFSLRHCAIQFICFVMISWRKKF